MRTMIKFLDEYIVILFIVIATLIAVSACTWSLNVVQTEGEASDVVDETQSNDPKIDPTLEVPINL